MWPTNGFRKNGRYDIRRLKIFSDIMTVPDNAS